MKLLLPTAYFATLFLLQTPPRATVDTGTVKSLSPKSDMEDTDTIDAGSTRAETVPSRSVGRDNFAAIRFADQFEGPDCGAKIAAADAQLPNTKGEIWVKRDCGSTISTWVPPQHSIRFIEGGTWDVSVTLLFNRGGVGIYGLGMLDSMDNPGTKLLWKGAAGSDLMQWQGPGGPRLDKIVMRDIILDGGNSARYALRVEKTDTDSIYDSRIRNAATANYYQVDSTGMAWYNVDIAAINGYGAILDWGSGGFNCFKCQFDQVVRGSTGQFLYINGASNSIAFYGAEMDAAHGAQVGFIRIDGFTDHSAFASAPAGGAGSPTTVSFNNVSIFYDGRDVLTPSQGADIVVNGASAEAPSQNVKITECYIRASNLGTIGIKADFTTGLTVSDCLSSGHTREAAAALAATSNAVGTTMVNVITRGDTNRIASGVVVDLQHTPTGTLAMNGNLTLTGGASSILGLGSDKGDPKGAAGYLFYRSDLSRPRYFDSSWHSLIAADTRDILTNKTLESPSLTLPTNNSSATMVLGTSTIAARTCAATLTATLPGITVSANFSWNFMSDPDEAGGYGSGGLQVLPWPAANAVKVKVCNPTGKDLVPGPMSIRVTINSIS